MVDDERIKWQFAPDFYKSKNSQIDHATMLVAMGDYETAFSMLKMVFLSIGEEIKKHDLEEYTKLKDMVIEIEGYNMEFNRYSKSPAYQNKSQVKKASVTLHQIRIRIDDFFENLHNMMWRLNMLVPKEKIDNRKDIYKN